jgi:hypothetical protein
MSKHLDLAETGDVGHEPVDPGADIDMALRFQRVDSPRDMQVLQKIVA